MFFLNVNFINSRNFPRSKIRLIYPVKTIPPPKRTVISLRYLKCGSQRSEASCQPPLPHTTLACITMWSLEISERGKKKKKKANSKTPKPFNLLKSYTTFIHSHQIQSHMLRSRIEVFKLHSPVQSSKPGVNMLSITHVV